MEKNLQGLGESRNMYSCSLDKALEGVHQLKTISSEARTRMSFCLHPKT